MTNKTILKDIFHIEGPISMAELTHKGETHTTIPWCKDEFVFSPYCVFERRNNILYYYYDGVGIEWKKKQSTKADKELVKKSILSAYRDVEKVFLTKDKLSKKELPVFIKLVDEFWIWMECLWWLVEYNEENTLKVDDLLKVRKATEHFIPGVKALVRNSISSIVPELSSFTDVLLLDEVLNDNIPEVEELEKRLVFCAYANSKIYLSEEDLLRELNIEIEHEKYDLKDKVLKGSVAYRGKVTGRVKIVNSVEDIKKFNKGDIIVSPTTTPDFLPAMKICSAIISEHGGVICHAAITSRELKIPCVVGVRGATKILKDGDMIEVDADNGIIKLINK